MTLDDLLIQYGTKNFLDRLEVLFDYTSWTKEDRDEKLKAIDKTFIAFADETVVFSQEVLDKVIWDKPLMFWLVYNSLLTRQMAIMQELREKLDMTDESTVLDYEWLNTHIRNYRRCIEKLDKDINEELSRLMGAQEV